MGLWVFLASASPSSQPFQSICFGFHGSTSADTGGNIGEGVSNVVAAGGVAAAEVVGVVVTGADVLCGDEESSLGEREHAMKVAKTSVIASLTFSKP